MRATPTPSTTQRTWMISMVPLVILVGMLRAWKKEVFSGPSPVFWAGTMTSSGARAPARAGAFTLFSRRASLMATRSSLVKTKPTLPLIWGRMRSRAGFWSRWPRMAFRIMVFLPMRTTARSRRDMRICCICLDPTLSASTYGKEERKRAVRNPHLSQHTNNVPHQEALWVLVKELNELKKVVCLPGGLVLPHHLDRG